MIGTPSERSNHCGHAVTVPEAQPRYRLVRAGAINPTEEPG
jgi:hypothetical protein